MKYACPICDLVTLKEDPLQPSSTHEICSNCHYQCGYEDGGGTLEQRQEKFPLLRERFKQIGRMSEIHIDPLPLLHLHAQHAFHDDAWILGNREALKQLRDALTQLLENGGTLDASGVRAHAVGLWANDGEGYNLNLLLDEDEKRWREARRGYTAEYAQNENGLHPHQIISKETYLKEYERGIQSLSGSKVKNDCALQR